MNPIYESLQNSGKIKASPQPCSVFLPRNCSVLSVRDPRKKGAKISLESARAISSFTLLSLQRGGRSCRHQGTKAWHLSPKTHPTAFGKAGVSEQHGEDSRLKQACRLFSDSVRKQMFCKRKIANILFSKDDYFSATRQVWSVWKPRCLGTTGTAAVCSDTPSSTSLSQAVPQPGPRILALEVKSEVHPIFGTFCQVSATHSSLWTLDLGQQSPLFWCSLLVHRSPLL